jgi:hypothetical protein
MAIFMGRMFCNAGNLAGHLAHSFFFVSQGLTVSRIGLIIRLLKTFGRPGSRVANLKQREAASVPPLTASLIPH